MKDLVQLFNDYIVGPRLETDESGEEIVVPGTAGNSVSDMFEMALCILRSHVIDMSKVLSDYLSPEISGLKNHHILWSLMLPKGRLYYRNEKGHTWIYNIYENYNDDPAYLKQCRRGSSLLLKRLILESFRSEQDEIMRHQMELYSVFVSHYGFDEIDLSRSLENLTSWGLLHKYQNDERIYLYCITRRGIFFRDYIQNQYIYHELVIEDTPIPKNLRKYIRLFGYRPIDENRSYFLRKVPMVRKFVLYLETLENIELKRLGIKSWFDGFRIFPALKADLKRQEESIAKSFGLEPKNISGKW